MFTKTKCVLKKLSPSAHTPNVIVYYTFYHNFR
jgi:hypothetical protein